MDRYHGYNRNDFYFPRTSREAFGSNFYVTNKANTIMKDIFLVVLWVILLIVLSYVLQT